MTLQIQKFIDDQRRWSLGVFGPGRRTRGITAHIRSELAEIESDPGDVEEWVDVMLLALDGAWRTGATPAQISDAIKAKSAVLRTRTYPDWRTLSEDDPIEHIRGTDSAKGVAPSP